MPSHSTHEPLDYYEEALKLIADACGETYRKSEDPRELAIRLKAKLLEDPTRIDESVDSISLNQSLRESMWSSFDLSGSGEQDFVLQKPFVWALNILDFTMDWPWLET